MDECVLIGDSFESFSSVLVDLCLKYGCTLHSISDKRVVLRMPCYWSKDSRILVIKFY